MGITKIRGNTQLLSNSITTEKIRGRTINEDDLAFGLDGAIFLDNSIPPSKIQGYAPGQVGWNKDGTNVHLVGLGDSVGIGMLNPETKLDLDGAMTLREMAVPAVAPLGRARMYFDSSLKKIRISENGSAYRDIGSGVAGDYIQSMADGDYKKVLRMEYNPTTGDLRIIYET